MALRYFLVVWLTSATWLACGMLRGQIKRSKVDLSSYSFADFAKDFGRSYSRGSKEYKVREALFHKSIERIHSTNAKNLAEGHPWTAGLHPFMDWTSQERKALNGYRPARARRQQGMAVLQRSSKGYQGHQTGSNISLGAVAFDQNSGPALRNQGNCGSCWAISAVEAVEAQLQRQGENPSTKLAAQALVDCVPNPQHCGGSGGCHGATGELAYTYMRDTGIPLEVDMPYHATADSCPQMASTGGWPSHTRARVSGWNQLPSNKAEPLMQALVDSGPVVVAVEGSNWFDYDHGIFDGCNQDATLGHAVLAKGYGAEDGKNYWLIQNSWGREWGEKGHIRLLKHEKEDSWCGQDRKPSEGVGCDGGPSEVTVCGMCGILYDPIQPQGVRLERADGPVPFQAEASAANVDAASTNTAIELPAATALTAEYTSTAPKTFDPKSVNTDGDQEMDDVLKEIR